MIFDENVDGAVVVGPRSFFFQTVLADWLLCPGKRKVLSSHEFQEEIVFSAPFVYHCESDFFVASLKGRENVKHKMCVTFPLSKLTTTERRIFWQSLLAPEADRKTFFFRFSSSWWWAPFNPFVLGRRGERGCFLSSKVQITVMVAHLVQSAFLRDCFPPEKGKVSWLGFIPCSRLCTKRSKMRINNRNPIQPFSVEWKWNRAGGSSSPNAQDSSSFLNICTTKRLPKVFWLIFSKIPFGKVLLRCLNWFGRRDLISLRIIKSGRMRLEMILLESSWSLVRWISCFELWHPNSTEMEITNLWILQVPSRKSRCLLAIPFWTSIMQALPWHGDWSITPVNPTNQYLQK